MSSTAFVILNIADNYFVILYVICIVQGFSAFGHSLFAVNICGYIGKNPVQMVFM